MPHTRTLLTCAAAVLMAAALPAHAADKKPAKGNTAEAAADRANCQKNHPQQDLAACLLEARNARADEKRGLLGGNPVAPANATRRCDPLPPADKADCIARVQGGGSASGSVEAGGVIRETTTTVPAK